MKTLYVGIDVSKNNLDIAVTLDGKQVIWRTKFSNKRNGLINTAKYIKKHSHQESCQNIHCIIESTGIYSEGIMDYLQEQEIPVTLINPAQVKAFGQSILVRTKTDRIDAELLCKYVAIIKPETTIRIPNEVKKLRNLERELEIKIRARAKLKNQFEAAIDVEISELISEDIQYYDRKIEDLEKRIKKHIKEHHQIQDNFELLNSIVGIGVRTASIILCELHAEAGGTKISHKAQTAHAGLAPQEKQSGSSVKGKTRICKTGNSRLRKALYFPTITAIKHNKVIKEFYEKLISKGKPKMVALVAAMRKLLVIAIGILNNKIPFDPNFVSRKREELVML